MSPIARKAGTKDIMVYHSKSEEDLGDLKDNLQHLTVGIPNMTTDEVPRRYQLHTTGVSV